MGQLTTGDTKNLPPYSQVPPLVWCTCPASPPEPSCESTWHRSPGKRKSGAPKTQPTSSTSMVSGS